MAYKALPPDAYRKLLVSWQAKFGRCGDRFYNTNKFGPNADGGSTTVSASFVIWEVKEEEINA